MVENSEKTPFVAIPVIVFSGLCLVWIMFMTFAMIFQMADWFPTEVTIGEQRFFGSEILFVIQKYLTRTMIVAWAILTILAFLLEFQYRKQIPVGSKE